MLAHMRKALLGVVLSTTLKVACTVEWYSVPVLVLEAVGENVIQKKGLLPKNSRRN